MRQSVEVEFEDDEDVVAWSQSDLSRRQRLAAELAASREDEVLALHDTTSRHYVDNLCSLVTGNMAIICWVLGGVYISRPCTKPLSAFLIVLGFLAPFAACLPIVVRQWVYLHLRLKNTVTIAILAMSALYVVWLMLGQRWAFESSSKNCDADLSTATNCVVFILYLTALVYAAKVIWYLALRARYSYKELIASCFQDPFPNALQMSDDDFTRLEAELSVSNDEVHHRTSKPRHNRSKKTNLRQQLQNHQHDLRQSLHRVLHGSSSSLHKITPSVRVSRKKSSRSRTTFLSNQRKHDDDVTAVE